MEDKVIEIILEEIKEMKSDIKELLKFKYSLFGVISVVTFVFTLVFSLIFK